MNSHPIPPSPPEPDQPLKPELASEPSAALAGAGEITGSEQATREEIQHRAYLLWKAEGCPDGKDVRHWLDAEVQIFGRGRLPR